MSVIRHFNPVGEPKASEGGRSQIFCQEHLVLHGMCGHYETTRRCFQFNQTHSGEMNHSIHFMSCKKECVFIQRHELRTNTACYDCHPGDLPPRPRYIERSDPHRDFIPNHIRHLRERHWRYMEARGDDDLDRAMRYKYSERERMASRKKQWEELSQFKKDEDLKCGKSPENSYSVVGQDSETNVLRPFVPPAPVAAPPPPIYSLAKTNRAQQDSLAAKTRGSPEIGQIHCTVCHMPVMDPEASSDKPSPAPYETMRGVTLPCAHHFHRDCIIPWICKYNTCPVCRRMYNIDIMPKFDDASWERDGRESEAEFIERERALRNPTIGVGAVPLFEHPFYDLIDMPSPDLHPSSDLHTFQID